MFKIAVRSWVGIFLLFVLPLTVTWAVHAASDPASTAATPPPGADASTYSAAYTAAIKVTGPTTQFHDSVSGRYNFAFGKESPFLPSNAMSVNGQFLNPKSFYTAQYCGHCHQEAYHQWRQSVHSNSFRAPWYLKNVNMLIDEKGVQFSRHCEGCHNPVALLSGDLSQGMPKKRPFEDEGLTCSTCHSIQSTDATGTGSYVMGIPAVLVDEKGAPVTRPVSDSEILAHLDRHSKAVMRPLYKTAEFCAACHKADHHSLARRLQVAPRLHRLRRVAGCQFHKAVPASLLSQRRGLHLPDLPHASRDASRRSPGSRRKRRSPRLAPLARWQHA